MPSGKKLLRISTGLKLLSRTSSGLSLEVAFRSRMRCMDKMTSRGSSSVIAMAASNHRFHASFGKSTFPRSLMFEDTAKAWVGFEEMHLESLDRILQNWRF